MPIWLRKYTYSLIKEHYEKPHPDSSSVKNPPGVKNLIDSSGKISHSGFKNQSSYK